MREYEVDFWWCWIMLKTGALQENENRVGGEGFVIGLFIYLW
jgi:hypothetical protein